MIRIKRIQIFHDVSFSSEIFDWQDMGKALNVFHFKNQFWKTTLYNVVRCLLSWDLLSSKNINIDVVWSAILALQIDDVTYTLKSNHKDFYFMKDGNPIIDIPYDQYMLEEVFWKDYWTDQIIYHKQEKTSVSSLMRFSFFSDEDFSSKDSCTADLIHVKFDGKGKFILLCYVLWWGLNNGVTWGEIFYDINELTKIDKEIWKIEGKLNSKNAKELQAISDGLFSDMWNKYKEVQNEKLELENLQSITKKMEILKLKAWNIGLWKQIMDYLDSEISFLSGSLKELQDRIKQKDDYLLCFSSEIDPQDVLTHEQLKNKKNALLEKKEIIERKLFSSLDLGKVIENYDNITSSFEWIFWFKVDCEEMKVALSNLSSEGILKCSKFLANLCFQIYSALYYQEKKKIPLLPIWFYDSVFGGVDIDNIITCFSQIWYLDQEIKDNIQIFVCTNRYNRGKNELDHFMEDKDWVYSYIVDEWQNFLFKV